MKRSMGGTHGMGVKQERRGPNHFRESYSKVRRLELNGGTADQLCAGIRDTIPDSA